MPRMVFKNDKSTKVGTEFCYEMNSIVDLDNLYFLKAVDQLTTVAVFEGFCII